MKDIQYIFMDIDGVLYRGHYPINGAKELIDYLIEEGIKFICITNNSAKTPSDYSKRLRNMKINIDEHEIINSGVATVEFLKDTFLKEKENLSAYVVGGDGLVSLIENSGIKIAWFVGVKYPSAMSQLLFNAPLLELSPYFFAVFLVIFLA